MWDVFTSVFFPFLFSNLLFLHFSSLLRIPPFCFLFSSILSLLNICFCLSSNTFLPHFSSCLLALPSFTIFVFSSASCSMIFSSSQTSFFSLIKLPFASPPALVLVLSTFVVFSQWRTISLPSSPIHIFIIAVFYLSFVSFVMASLSSFSLRNLFTLSSSPSLHTWPALFPYLLTLFSLIL